MCLMTCYRRHKQHGTPIWLLLHLIGCCLRKEKGPRKVYLHYLKEGFRGIGEEIPEKGDACVGNDDVQAPILLYGFVHHLMDQIDVAAISGDSPTGSCGLPHYFGHCLCGKLGVYVV